MMPDPYQPPLIPQQNWTPPTQYQPPQGTYFLQPGQVPQGQYQRPTFTPPSKRSKIGWVVVGVIAALMVLAVIVSPSFQKGFKEGQAAVAVPSATASTKTAPSVVPPAAPVTVVVKETVTAAPKTSTNMSLLQVTFQGMSASDQASIRDPWRQYKDSPSLAAVFVSAFMEGLQKTLPTLTEPEVIEFLNWTLTH